MKMKEGQSVVAPKASTRQLRRRPPASPSILSDTSESGTLDDFPGTDIDSIDEPTSSTPVPIKTTSVPEPRKPSKTRPESKTPPSDSDADRLFEGIAWLVQMLSPVILSSSCISNTWTPNDIYVCYVTTFLSWTIVILLSSITRNKRPLLRFVLLQGIIVVFLAPLFWWHFHFYGNASKFWTSLVSSNHTLGPEDFVGEQPAVRLMESVQLTTAWPYTPMVRRFVVGERGAPTSASCVNLPFTATWTWNDGTATRNRDGV